MILVRKAVLAVVFMTATVGLLTLTSAYHQQHPSTPSVNTIRQQHYFRWGVSQQLR
jgi:hypothetical protein